MDETAGLRGAPLNALRSFETAARRLSFANAAAELGVTPSAISIQIRRLEARIGRPLFERGHRRVSLSPLGARLAPALSAIFRDLDRLLEITLAAETDTLMISAMPSFATKWLAPRLAAFNALWPSIGVRVVGADHLVDFDHDGVDVGLRYGPGDYSGLYVERLAQARAFPVCSPGFRDAHADLLRTASGLARLQLIGDETALRASGLPDWGAWFSAAGAKGIPRIGPVFESLHMALSGAAAGQGVALGLTPLVDEDLRSGALVRLFATEIVSPYSFWLVCRKDRLRDRKVRAFRDWMVSAVARGGAARLEP
ncbi:LysR substrate-binding domain-containing protein [Phenylobacterium sp.]|uniref:LysR substrate-binding domain-containing protein n=1 Tax=Phenylobacterium sp. TaxID=1871053 RepID=UPI001210D240|nr:LysR substrate-binding domain-containing protein [Phenylobacterium sp.]THD59054.1 MAG: LysR family transcriptional regulator [Phenylobacterium sp.]